MCLKVPSPHTLQVSCADEEPGGRLSIKLHKAHILFGGTKVLQHTGDKNARIRWGAAWLGVHA